MCGRMTLTRRDLHELADELAAACAPEALAVDRWGPAGPYRPRYNVAPTDPHPILRLVGGARRLLPSRWGLPPTARRRAPLINVRSETVSFSRKELLADQRCVVPAVGFYEWKRDGAAPQPIWFHRPDGRLLLFAGLWDGDHFTVLTTTANGVVSGVHDRMPVILSPDDAEVWLLAPAGKLLRPAPDDALAARPVSTRVNSVRND